METQEISPEAIKAVETMTNFVNTFGYDRKGFVEWMQRQHRTLQQSFTSLVLLWLRTVASNDYRTDGRNEYSQTIARKLLKDVEDWETNCPLI